MYGADDPYGSAGYATSVSARVFVETAPINAQHKAKFAHLNAERRFYFLISTLDHYPDRLLSGIAAGGWAVSRRLVGSTRAVR
jgi:hypothetical protein